MLPGCLIRLLLRRRYFTERLVRACAELPKLCEFFHIPFQAGDNDILRAMKWGPLSSCPMCALPASCSSSHVYPVLIKNAA
jgi:hypothetical protein